MPTQEEIYKTEGDKYEALIAHEDYQGNILRVLRGLVSLEKLVVYDLGAGTGRLACLLAPHVTAVRAFDISSEMLRVCREKFIASKLSNWQVDVADHRQLPVDDASADLVVSGWSVSYLAVWNPDSWRAELEKWLGEMKRVLRPNSSIILFESLGTGNESPVELAHLSDFYVWLAEVGFQRQWIRTDYKFDSVQQSLEIAGFFFGDEMSEKIRRHDWQILPECTGVWCLRI